MRLYTQSEAEVSTQSKHRDYMTDYSDNEAIESITGLNFQAHSSVMMTRSSHIDWLPSSIKCASAHRTICENSYNFRTMFCNKVDCLWRFVNNDFRTYVYAQYYAILLYVKICIYQITKVFKNVTSSKQSRVIQILLCVS